MTSLQIVTAGGGSVGLGHIRRCLTLAAALRNRDVEIAFHVDGDAALIREAGFAVEEIDADGVLFDTYGAREEHFRACAPRKTIVIDDVADRTLPVDLVVNTAPGAARFTYSDARGKLLGARYALLRPEFANVPDRNTRDRIERVMVTLGGNDHGTLASAVVRATLEAAPHADLEVVVGPFFERVDLLRALGERVVLLENANMREVMLRADVAVSAGGQTLFELAATGTPAVVVITAENQTHQAHDFAEAGSVRLGDIATAFAQIREPRVREEMTRRGRALVDGRGAERVASAIVELLRGNRT
ncbi:MAG TPA: glycosyltransferase [Thermoanaerobaculia bacterium]|nr:glycosyltransferase [Thermoanaerobaculia bacterium]